MREAQVRFYLDADILGLAKVLTQLRADVTYPGDPGGVVRKRLRPACPITTPATEDSVWIPQVTALGWLIVTRDSKIQSHRAEVGRSGSIESAPRAGPDLVANREAYTCTQSRCIVCV